MNESMPKMNMPECVLIFVLSFVFSAAAKRENAKNYGKIFLLIFLLSNGFECVFWFLCKYNTAL